MAGKARFKALVQMIEDFGEDALLDLVEQGMTTREIYELFGCSNRVFYYWLDQAEGRRQRFADARKVYAETLDKEGLDIADNVPVDKEHIAKAKLQIEQRRHVASIHDRSRQQRDQAGVVVNIGSLHLQAVRERMQLGSGIQEAEVIAEEVDGDRRGEE